MVQGSVSSSDACLPLCSVPRVPLPSCPSAWAHWAPGASGK